MTNEPIKIIIEDQSGTEKVQGGGGANVKQPDSMPNEQASNNKNNSLLTTAGALIAMKSVTYATSNVGKWLGNSRYQQVVDTTQRAITYGMAFAANVYVGLATVALDTITNVADVAYNTYWENLKAEQRQTKYGTKGGFRR